jgi:glycosyltransferase A (GT-A) superfamily protein (DUF2064 family)
VTAPVALVMAKAPVRGRVKTRLARHVGDAAAARLAAAALADTIDACSVSFGADRCYLALEGTLAHGEGGDELDALLAGWTVLPQRGEGLGPRLAHAHHDTAAVARAPVVQVGMDTPQVTAHDLGLVAACLARCDAVLGPADDGGWWVLGLHDPRLARCLTTVAMSTTRTGADTRAALTAAGARVVPAPPQCDVDEPADAARVAGLAPHSRFARRWAVEAGRPAPW